MQKALDLIKKKVSSQGYLILQALTDKYPAPIIQPELEGVIISEQKLINSFCPEEWRIIHCDNKDIIHSHTGSEQNHMHGSIRMIIQKVQ